jgi:arylsulfatase A-like enzyme
MTSGDAGDGRGVDDEQQRPNVLWVIVDQWRGQATGYVGDPNAVTPNLDRLAAESVRFDCAFSSHPLCVPFRGALLTGRRGTSTGVTGHKSSMPAGTRTIAHTLRENGYRTAWFGKWHLSDHVPPPGLRKGAASEWVATRIVPPDRRGGFDHWEAFEGGNVINDPWLHTDRDPTPRRRPGYQSDVIFSACADYIGANDGDAPWFAVCSVEPPHDPYDAAPPEYAERYDPATIKLRPNVPSSEPVNSTARRYLAGYYASIEATDAALGRLLAEVDSHAGGRPTAVVFMSDHGDMLGSHGRYKKTQPYEESIRIPLVIRWPGVRGRGAVTDALACEIDIAPTMLDMLGMSIPPDLHGTSLAAQLDDPSAPGPDYVLLQHIDGLAHADTMNVPWRAIRTRDALYGVTAGQECWLFDLENDPYETRNLASIGSGRVLRRELRPLLEKALSEAHDPFRLPAWGAE